MQERCSGGSLRAMVIAQMESPDTVHSSMLSNSCCTNSGLNSSANEVSRSPTQLKDDQVDCSNGIRICEVTRLRVYDAPDWINTLGDSCARAALGYLVQKS